MKEIKSLIKVSWVEYPHYHQKPDTEGYISLKAFINGREKPKDLRQTGKDHMLDIVSITLTIHFPYHRQKRDILNVGKSQV